MKIRKEEFYVVKLVQMNFSFLKKYPLLFIVFLFFDVSSIVAQQAQITGKFLDAKDNSPLVGVGVMLMNKADTNKTVQSSSDANGRFYFNSISKGEYILRTFYVGYKKMEAQISITGAIQKVGVFKLEQVTTKLKAVVFEEKAIRSVQKNDTTEYHANAFKVNTDASSQDLVTKMPGITVENGTVKAQGETLQKVMIDGKEFFGDDAVIALKNLPAEVVDKIQVFDKLSDQSQFTGFDDGNTKKTMNIVTKSGKSNGAFGKVYGGYGADENYNDRFNAGGNLNFFKGKRRITIIGLTNNINQQNFSSQDLLGVTSGQGGGGGGGGFGGGMMGRPGGDGGAGNNFLVGNQSGINITNSLGLNYSDMWGKKIAITGSYFFNDVANTTSNNLTRNYYSKSDTNQQYNQSSSSNSNNSNHRINIRLEYTIDSFNSIIITPKLSYQNYSSGYTLFGANSLSSGIPLNQTIDSNYTKNSGYTFTNSILLRHKFLKVGRTVSLSLETNANSKTASSDLYAKNSYYIPSDSSVINNQQTLTSANGYTIGASLNYTEPIGKAAQLMFNYTPSYQGNISDKETKIQDTLTKEFTHLNPVLSSSFNSPIITQRGGFNYRMRLENGMLMAGVNYQSVELSGSQTLPTVASVSKTFNNYLPTAMFHYKLNKNNTVRMYYRTSTNTPSITQLQTVVDNSNPLMLSVGNPYLIQSYSHTFITRYSYSNPDKGRTFFMMLNGNTTNNYFGNSTLIGDGKTVSNEGVLLQRGTQLSKPLNIDGYWNVNSFFTYGFVFKKLKSNLNLNAGYTYNRTPSLMNNLTNFANTNTINSGFVLGSNISEKVDFTVSYTAFYNIIDNTIQSQSNGNYFYHATSGKVNLLPWKGLVLTSDITESYYTGLTSSYNINYFLWNAGVGYKFMKNNAAELKIVAYDILNQNNSISRNITGSYIEDSRTNVLKRYFMLMFTYNIRNFNAGAMPNQPMRNN